MSWDGGCDEEEMGEVGVIRKGVDLDVEEVEDLGMVEDVGGMEEVGMGVGEGGVCVVREIGVDSELFVVVVVNKIGCIIIITDICWFFILL